MKKLVEGVRRFQEHLSPEERKQYEELAAKGQHPRAVFVTCADSRVMPNAITDSGPGDLFYVRNAGNIVPPHGPDAGGEAATIEYALTALGIRQIIVCGHTQCGAMKAILETPEKLEPLPSVRQWLRHAETTRQIVAHKYPNVSEKEREVAAIEENVLVQLNNLSTHPIVAALLATDELKLFGWVTDIATGGVRQYDADSGKFVDLTDDGSAISPIPLRTRQ
ncbi:MAG: carbonic anhydrase [Planctomycetota bacterium]